MSAGSAVQALRRFREASTDATRCAFCGMAVESAHPHRLDPEGWQVICACNACDRDRADEPRLRRVGHRVEKIEDPRVGERMLMVVDVPVGLAFFTRTRRAANVFYPAPTGTAEARIDVETWAALEAELPEVARLEPEVEAIVVSLSPRRTFVVPIDECFRLAGMLRSAWVGWSGGAEARSAIEDFFATLETRANSGA